MKEGKILQHNYLVLPNAILHGMQVTYISGNPERAERFQRLIGRDISHSPLDLSEIQSLDLQEIVEDKARRAFEEVKAPVIVEDTSLVFHALGKLPGPFIKWFVKGMPLQTICDLLPQKDRSATAGSMFAYFDGNTLRIFSRTANGSIPTEPRGSNGFGWDAIFIPEGYSITRAEMTLEESERYYAEVSRPFRELRDFLNTLQQ